MLFFSQFLEIKRSKIRLSKKAIRWLYKRFYKRGGDAELLPLKQGLKLGGGGADGPGNPDAELLPLKQGLKLSIHATSRVDIF